MGPSSIRLTKTLKPAAYARAVRSGASSDESIVASWGTPAGASWSVFAAFRIPESGPDVFTTNRSSAVPVVFTIKESTSKFIKVVLDRDTNPFLPGSIKLIDHNGQSATIAGPAASEGGISFAQAFYFLRGRQVLLGVTRYQDLDSLFKYRVWASVAGTRTKVVQGITNLADVRPSQLNSGDQSAGNIDPAEFFAWWIDDASSTSESAGTTMLEQLTFAAPL